MTWCAGSGESYKECLMKKLIKRDLKAHFESVASEVSQPRTHESYERRSQHFPAGGRDGGGQAGEREQNVHACDHAASGRQQSIAYRQGIV